MNAATLDQIVSKLTREQCLQILNSPGVDLAALQRALSAVTTSGGAPVAAPATPVAAPSTPTPAAPKAPKAPKAATTPPTSTGVAPVDAIKAAVAQGLGFSAGDIGTVCGLEPRDSSIRTAIKNALAAKVIVSFGEKRFMRYGATEEIAKAASLKAAGKA